MTPTLTVDVEAWLESMWDFRDRVILSDNKHPKLIALAQQLIALESNYNPVFHVQVLEKDKRAGTDHTLYVIWRRADWDTDVAKQVTLRERSDKISSHFNRKKDLVTKLQYAIGEHLNSEPDGDVVAILVDSIISTKNSVLAEHFGVVKDNLSVLFEEIPR